MTKLEAYELEGQCYDYQFLVKGIGHSVENLAAAIEQLTGGQDTVSATDRVVTGWYRWIPERDTDVIRLHSSTPGRGAFPATVITPLTPRC